MLRIALFLWTSAVLTAASAPLDDRDRAERRLGEDYFATGRTLSVASPVQGDLLAAGRDITIDANVGGDTVVAGSIVRARGNIADTLYAAAGRLLIEGDVQRNARIAGRQVEIAPSSSIHGNVSLAGSDVRVDGKVDGYLQATGGRVVINGPVGGDVEMTSRHVELGPNARIAGNLRYTSPQPIKRAPEAQVTGTVEHIQSRGGWTASRSIGLLAWGIWTIGLMILAAVAVALLPRIYSRITSTLENRPGMSLLVGLLSFIGIPLAAFILLITVIGIPLSFVLITIFLAMLTLAFVATSATVGDWILRRYRPELSSATSWRVGATVLGVVLIGLAGMVPFIGGMVVFAALLFGLGAMIMQLRRPPAVAAI
jgi:cytoskeletal protein CcmA (bactofilin family)